MIAEAFIFLLRVCMKTIFFVAKLFICKPKTKCSVSKLHEIFKNFFPFLFIRQFLPF